MSRRLTKNKKLILDAFSKHHILDATKLKKLYPEIDLSVIYRNLSRFEEDGLIKRVNITVDTISYELVDFDHQHVVCKECGEVQAVEINTDQIRELVSSNFNIESLEIVLKGKCLDCKNI